MEKEIKILILEDNPADAELVERTLKSAGLHFRSLITASKNDFVLALDHFYPDVVLSDHSLPQFDSFRALAILKEKDTRIPFIIVTGTVSEEFAVQCLKGGADDYILKNNLIRLPSAIQHAIERKVAETEKQKATESLHLKNEELNTLIYRSSHDLRAPVTSLLGLVNVSRKEVKDPVALKYIDIFEKTSLKLDSILRDLMDNARVSYGQLSAMPVELSDCIGQILNNLEYLEEARAVSIRTEIPDGLTVVTDNRLIESVLQNLIHNAIKYRKNGIPDSWIKIKASVSEGTVTIEISDNGKGMPQNIVDRIFEMFFKGDAGSKGTGLGLYIVKNSVEKLGGTINVKSEEGRGTTFTIVLPHGN